MAKEFARAEGIRIEITNEQSKQIRQLYRDLAKEYKQELRVLETKSNVSSVMRSEYLKDYVKSLERDIEYLNSNVEKTITSNMLRVSEAVVKDSISLDKKMGFEGVFTKQFYIPQDVVAMVSSGKLYDGKWTLSKAIWSDNQKKINDINLIVAKGIAGNKSTYDIAKDLERYVNPRARKLWDWSKVYPHTSKKIDYNAQRLARTMVSHAYQESFVESTKDNPFIEAYRWEASGSDRMCQICEDRDGQIFAKDDLPLDHPNGMCTFSIVLEKSYEQIGKEIANWINGEGDPKLNDQLDNYAETLGYNVKRMTTSNISNVFGDKDLKVTSTHSGDQITIDMALESWARNATGIRAASDGDTYGRLFGPVGLNDEAKAQVIEKWIDQGNGVSVPIFRGLSELNEQDFAKFTTVGNIVDQDGLSSWTTDNKVAVGYGQYGRSVVLVQEDGTEMGRRLTDTYKATDIENEVIVSAKARQEVLRTEEKEYYTKVYMKEIDPDNN